MTTRCEDVRENEKTLLSLTSLKRAEFEMLLPVFERAWDEQEAADIEARGDRQRARGGGRKAALAAIEDKLLFILFFFKTSPLQETLGVMFGMSQSRANDWIHRLSGVARAALDKLGMLPERNPEKLAELLAEDGTDEVAIDGTERRMQRPKDDERQREHCSGKEKAHTVKNNVVVGAKDRKVKYLSGTCEGKKSDKKLCDEENPTFPDNVTLCKDKGFQGYEPEGVRTRQPKKKPRKGELSVDEKVENAIISGVGIVVEHVISGIKRCRIVKDVFRNTKEGFRDLVMEIACGLHNFRTECR